MVAQTLSQIRSRIKSDLAINSSIYDAQIDDAIRSAIRQYKGRAFWFLEKVDSLTFEEDTTSAALPSDFGSLILARVLRNGSYYDLTYVAGWRDFTREYRASYSDGALVSSYPQAFSLLGESLHFDVTADTDYTIELSYYKHDATEPTADGHTSVWLDDGRDAIRSLAFAMFKDEAQDYQAAGADWSRAQIYLDRLENTNLGRLGI